MIWIEHFIPLSFAYIMAHQIEVDHDYVEIFRIN